MSIFFRGVERRDFGSPPQIPSNGSRGGAFSTRRVDLSSADAAMQKVAVSASVNLLATVANMLPMNVYTGSGAGKRQITAPSWLEDLGGAGHGTPDFAWQSVYCWGLRGNLVGLILGRDSVTGKPRQIDLQHPDDVSVTLSPDGTPEWKIKGRVQDPASVFHRRIYPVPGITLGASPVAQHALTIGLGLASEQFGAQFFLDGGHPTALFQNTEKTIDADAAKTIKERVSAVLRGSRESLVVGKDWKYTPIQVAPNESQFLATNEYTNAECARIYGPGMPEMLGYTTGGSMTYANIEQRAIDLLTFTIDPWLVRLERMFTDLLPAPQFVRFNRKALLQTDILTRFQVHEIALRNRIETVNEVRELEDEAPVSWGGKPQATKPQTPAEASMRLTPAVGTIVTSDEARDLVNEAGGDLPVPGPEFPAKPAAPAAPAVPDVMNGAGA